MTRARLARALVVGQGARALASSTAAALRAMARGDLTLAALGEARDPELRAALEALQGKLREIVRGARGAHRDATAVLIGVDVACRDLADAAARQRVSLDRAVEETQRASARAEELAPWAAEVAANAERIAVLSLNTGIEGMRGGTEAARALISLGEEIRRTAQRVGVTAEALSSGASGVGKALAATQSRLEEARTSAQGLAQEVGRASAAVESAKSSASALRAALSDISMLDDETEALVASVTDSAGRLAAELRAVRARVGEEAEGSAAREAVERAIRELASLGGG
ncbi:MAG: hypothetical protein R3A48_17085 [Polyangiales bacterium]